jgi:uncharacterized membrane protein YgaE (UPF0421/DUF939 family)
VISSARIAIAATTSFLIARVAGLPETYWAPIITLVIMQSTLHATLKLSGERLIGTALGALAGGLLMHSFPPAWWVFTAGVFLLGLLCTILHLQNSYRFAGITLAIVILIPHTAAPWIVALHRSIEVTIGIVVGLVMTVLWPEPAGETV